MVAKQFNTTVLSETVQYGGETAQYGGETAQ